MNTSLMLMQQLVHDRTAAYQAKADKARRGKFLRRASAASSVGLLRFPLESASRRTTGTVPQCLAA